MIKVLSIGLHLVLPARWNSSHAKRASRPRNVNATIRSAEKGLTAPHPWEDPAAPSAQLDLPHLLTWR